MGSSNKKKKEKKKDFQVREMPGIFPPALKCHQPCSLTYPYQKAKLKVGKAKAKANNFTDTSFKSKCSYAPASIIYPPWAIY